MSGPKYIIPAASAVKALIIWILQGVVHEYSRGFRKNHVEEGIDDLGRRHRRPDLLVPGLLSIRAEIHGEGHEMSSNFIVFQHSSAYVVGRDEMRGLPLRILCVRLSSSIAGNNRQYRSTLYIANSGQV